jgi:hypothetical protein
MNVLISMEQAKGIYCVENVIFSLLPIPCDKRGTYSIMSWYLSPPINSNDSFLWNLTFTSGY